MQEHRSFKACYPRFVCVKTNGKVIRQ